MSKHNKEKQNDIYVYMVGILLLGGVAIFFYFITPYMIYFKKMFICGC